jgi:ABC-2 type transport system permease protein
MKPVDLKMFKIGARRIQRRRNAAGVHDRLRAVVLLYMSVLFLYSAARRDRENVHIVEVLISSVRPTQMMLGKPVGMVQVSDPNEYSPSAASLSSLASRCLLERAKIPAIPESACVLFFTLCSAFPHQLYTNGGAGVASEEEAQQAQFPGHAADRRADDDFRIGMANPNSTSRSAHRCFFAPTLMMLRIAVINPPLWQIILSMLIMVLTILGAVWVAARIYRVGILMYGKRPSIAELGRWLRYS